MKVRKIVAIAAGVAVAACALPGLAACDDNNVDEANVYTIKQAYTESNKDQIPGDAVNQVMFAYSETNATFETKLTLDTDNLTYTLYKSIVTDKTEMDDGSMDYAFKGEWEFKGNYTVNESNANDIVLVVPTSGKYNVYYPTALNYQSIEKQTQGWVDSDEYPTLMTRFNKWYPVKAATVVDQPVTLSGKTMTFGTVDLTVPDEGDEGDEGEEEEDMSGWGLDDEALIAVGAGGKALNIYEDGTYTVVYPAYNLTDEGTWEFAQTATSATLTLTAGESVITGSVDSAGKLAIHYVFSTLSMIEQDFELTYSHWSLLMSSGN